MLGSVTIPASANSAIFNVDDRQIALRQAAHIHKEMAPLDR